MLLLLVVSLGVTEIAQSFCVCVCLHVWLCFKEAAKVELEPLSDTQSNERAMPRRLGIFFF